MNRQTMWVNKPREWRKLLARYAGLLVGIYYVALTVIGVVLSIAIIWLDQIKDWLKLWWVFTIPIVPASLAVIWEVWRDHKARLPLPAPATVEVESTTKKWGEQSKQAHTDYRAPFTVPLLPHHFVARPDVLTVLKEKILSTNAPNRLVISAVFGMAGIGKSTIAASLARSEEVRHRFSDGILWVTLGLHPDILTLLADQIKEMGDRDFQASSIAAATKHFSSQLHEKNVLLVLDDVWNVAHIKPFLVTSGSSQLLVTTRQRNTAQDVGAELYELHELSLGQSIDLICRLLDRGMTDQERNEAADLCEALAYLPQALELAISLVTRGSLTLAEVNRLIRTEVYKVQALERRKGILGAASDRSLSLQASINISLRAIGDENLRCFAWLGIVSEDSSIFATTTAKLWDKSPEESQNILSYLADRSLLRVVRREGYSAVEYQMHDILRDRAIHLIQQPKERNVEDGLTGLGFSSLSEANADFVAKCLREADGNIARLWNELGSDSYLQSHLVRHMHAADMEAEAQRYLAAEDINGRNIVLDARISLGQVAGYIEDALRAAAVSNQKVDSFIANLEESEPRVSSNVESTKSVNYVCTQTLAPVLASVSQQICYYLTIASLRSMATIVPPKLVVELIAYGIWSITRAIDYLDQSGDGTSLLEVSSDLVKLARNYQPDQNRLLRRLVSLPEFYTQRDANGDFLWMNEAIRSELSVSFFEEIYRLIEVGSENNVGSWHIDMCIGALSVLKPRILHADSESVEDAQSILSKLDVIFWEMIDQCDKTMQASAIVKYLIATNPDSPEVLFKEKVEEYETLYQSISGLEALIDLAQICSVSFQGDILKKVLQHMRPGLSAKTLICLGNLLPCNLVLRGLRASERQLDLAERTTFCSAILRSTLRDTRSGLATAKVLVRNLEKLAEKDEPYFVLRHVAETYPRLPKHYKRKVVKIARTLTNCRLTEWVLNVIGIRSNVDTAAILFDVLASIDSDISRPEWYLQWDVQGDLRNIEEILAVASNISFPGVADWYTSRPKISNPSVLRILLPHLRRDIAGEILQRALAMLVIDDNDATIYAQSSLLPYLSDDKRLSVVSDLCDQVAQMQSITIRDASATSLSVHLASMLENDRSLSILDLISDEGAQYSARYHLGLEFAAQENLEMASKQVELLRELVGVKVAEEIDDYLFFMKTYDEQTSLVKNMSAAPFDSSVRLLERILSLDTSSLFDAPQARLALQAISQGCENDPQLSRREAILVKALLNRLSILEQEEMANKILDQLAQNGLGRLALLSELSCAAQQYNALFNEESRLQLSILGADSQEFIEVHLILAEHHLARLQSGDTKVESQFWEHIEANREARGAHWELASLLVRAMIQQCSAGLKQKALGCLLELDLLVDLRVADDPGCGIVQDDDRQTAAIQAMLPAVDNLSGAVLAELISAVEKSLLSYLPRVNLSDDPIIPNAFRVFGPYFSEEEVYRLLRKSLGEIAWVECISQLDDRASCALVRYAVNDVLQFQPSKRRIGMIMLMPQIYALPTCDLYEFFRSQIVDLARGTREIFLMFTPVWAPLVADICGPDAIDEIYEIIKRVCRWMP